MPRLHGRTPEEHAMGSTPDNSPYDWYQVVYYWTPVEQFPHERKLIGRWIGVSENCVDEMAYVIVTHKGKVVIRKSLRGLSDDNLSNPAIKAELAELDSAIVKTGNILLGSGMPLLVEDVLYSDDYELAAHVNDDLASLEYHDVTPEELDEYLNTELLMSTGEEFVQAKVIKRKHDADDNPMGKRHTNPILDTRKYDIQFPDGSIGMFDANIIAKNLYSQVDPEGRSHTIFRDIINHRCNEKVTANHTCVNKNGKTVPHKTTAGWEMEVQWTDGSTDWLPFKDLTDSNPMETAKYAISNGISEEPAFSW
jgi:hypothetical protein